ncbi:hypothetical protein OG842_18360 [Streptomyces sp. NBC_00376]|uniref:hypothetical protein n=1 Tax=Streptomyces sp. NBC_00376 TaxID=2975730 RepID=UPI002E1D05B0
MAEWRILEPAWRTFFLRTQVRELLQVRLRLAPDRHEVRAVDRMWQVTWAGDTPVIFFAVLQEGRWPPGPA